LQTIAAYGNIFVFSKLSTCVAEELKYYNKELLFTTKKLIFIEKKALLRAF